MGYIKSKYGNPLWAQLLVTLLLTAVVIAYLGGEYIRSSEVPRRLAHAEMMMQSQLALVVSTTLDAMIAEDIAVIETAINGLALVSKDIHRLEVVNVNNKVLIDWRRSNYSPISDDVQFVRISQPIHFEGETFGSLRADWNVYNTLVEIEQQINEVRINIFIFMLITAAVLLAWVQWLVIRPVSRINQRLLSGASSEAILPFFWIAKEFRILANSVIRFEEVTISKAELEKEVELRKITEIALLNARDDALAANRAKSNFLANMSHELRTPLNAIIGYSEMMEEDAKSSGHEQYVNDLGRIHEAGDHLLVLINEILDLSKIEAGKMKLYLETFSLPETIQSIAATLEPIAQKNNNTIVLKDISAVKHIKADATKVRQILINLLSNALKFTENGEVVISVNSKPAGNIEGVEILVADSGIGISQQAQETLFNPFQQADSSTTRKYGGTGLGLSLCKRLCEMMQGDIWVKSGSGRGAIFGIWLPQVVEDPDDELETYYHAKRDISNPQYVRLPESKQQNTEGNERRNKIATVLTIDDDANVLDLMKRVYQREGFRSISASSGEEGLELARKLKPDLITLDIMMPGKDGWSVLESLKKDAELKDIPVIMVSIVADRMMAIDVGAMDAITKPIAWDKLLDITRKAVRNKSALD